MSAWFSNLYILFATALKHNGFVEHNLAFKKPCNGLTDAETVKYNGLWVSVQITSRYWTCFLEYFFNKETLLVDVLSRGNVPSSSDRLKYLQMGY